MKKPNITELTPVYHPGCNKDTSLCIRLDALIGKRKGLVKRNASEKIIEHNADEIDAIRDAIRADVNKMTFSHWCVYDADGCAPDVVEAKAMQITLRHWKPAKLLRPLSEEIIEEEE